MGGVSLATQPALRASSAGTSGGGLAPLEVEVIDLFVAASRLIGVPRSLGEIYGLLFISPGPLTLDALVERLKISKGSASQGLKTLRQIGAAKVTYVPGDRRDHYLAEIELKKLVSGFIGGQLMPHLETGEARLDRLRELQKQMEVRNGSSLTAAQRDRIKKLEQWHRRARSLAPLVEKFLG
jgi:DNA-binding transcriptional regulator GbsR (MarR family)